MEIGIGQITFFVYWDNYMRLFSMIDILMLNQP